LLHIIVAMLLPRNNDFGPMFLVKQIEVTYGANFQELIHGTAADIRKCRWRKQQCYWNETVADGLNQWY